ncbi:tripartite tricarboxylate transporter TctB family protein [Salibacterium aidingense]|uniref:tripartite tricarboxylate transporter TctB family protein n=1 Tax=Salibacterium aidingense TaxID=384933 RepID=UPI00040E2389|nr:tripartite tricarboxylate transporter TctB family protein [Salibacterium aidingense]
MPGLLKIKDLIAAVLLLILSIAMYLMTFNFERLTVSQIGPDFAPRLTAGGIFVLSLVLLFQTLLDWKRAKKENSGKVTEGHAEQEQAEVVEEDTPKVERYRNVALTTGLILLYIYLMPKLGFLITTTVYLFVQFCLLGQKKTWNFLLFTFLSVTTAVVVYYVFRFGFELRLPDGILG